MRWFFATIAVANLFEAYANWQEEEFFIMWGNLLIAGASVYCIISPEVY